MQDVYIDDTPHKGVEVRVREQGGSQRPPLVHRPVAPCASGINLSPVVHAHLWAAFCDQRPQGGATGAVPTKELQCAGRKAAVIFVPFKGRWCAYPVAPCREPAQTAWRGLHWMTITHQPTL